MRLKVLVFLILTGIVFTFPVKIFAQGKNHNWEIGYDTGLFDTSVTSTKALLNYSANQIQDSPKSFTMPFRAAQGNISDENGKLIICENGCWIADSTGNQMLNGDNLNPNSFTNSWCTATTGIPIMHSSIILPFPGDSTKYILFHQTGNVNANNMSTEFYYTLIDITLNNGLGAVTLKNQIIIQDTLNDGINACKHANGRDWWIIVLKDHSDSVYKVLLTPFGITSVTTQSLGFTPHDGFNGQPQFSPDGTKFAYHQRIYGPNGHPVTHEIRYVNFDRCTGNFYSPQLISMVDYYSGYGLAFSSNSKYLYFSTWYKILQLNTDTTNISASLDTVANYDGYCYPDNQSCTDFWFMYLAADSKIYITSGSSVIDIHCISSPDSAGVQCNVQQHLIRTPCYTGRGNVLHPNYYLGPVIGSACDTLAHVGLQEHLEEIQNFQISPNPLQDGALKITYLLPQNKSGVFELFDTNGKVLFTQKLPEWSSLQYLYLPELSNGLYYCSITSGNSRMTQKLIVLKK
jgi:hypothetical protein